MKSIIFKKIIYAPFLLLFMNVTRAQTYTFPDETAPHEGTWLQWPHQYEYGTAYRNSLDATWVAMTDALQVNENVHIIAYNLTEQARITNLLTNADVPLTNINFKLFQTNDVWEKSGDGELFRNKLRWRIEQAWRCKTARGVNCNRC